MNKCECCQNESNNLQRQGNLAHQVGFCGDCIAVIEKIPSDRILTVWGARTILSQGSPRGYTEGERAIVRELWDRIPCGSSSWMSAFYCFLHWAERQFTGATTGATA